MIQHAIVRSLVALTACLVSANGALAAEPAPSKIVWETNLWPAYQQALREHKPLVIYFYIDGSEWCDKLNNTWADPAVQKQFAGRAIFVHVNAEKDEDERGNVRRLVQQLNTDRWPTVWVVQPYTDKLTDVGRIRGYFAPDDFSPKLEKVLGLAAKLK